MEIKAVMFYDYCSREAAKRLFFSGPASKAENGFLTKKIPKNFWTKIAIFLAKYRKKTVKKNYDFVTRQHNLTGS